MLQKCRKQDIVTNNKKTVEYLAQDLDNYFLFHKFVTYKLQIENFVLHKNS